MVNNFDNSISRLQKKRIGERELRSWFKLAVFAIALAFFFNGILIVNATIPTGSMHPTISEGSRIVAFRLAYMFSEPSRFDVVVLRSPDDDNTRYIKRIIGLPGERVDIVHGMVFIDESHEPLHEWYLSEEPIKQHMSFVVPEGSFFLLGDYRNNSRDSRSWQNPFLEEENILGRAIFTYFPTIGVIR